MAKKKLRSSSGNPTIQGTAIQPPQGKSSGKNHVVSPVYNAGKYIKNDVMWTVITAGIVVIAMVILFYTVG